MARLILLNGPPAIGKSTLARRYVDDHPLVLHLEIDALRVSLGRWQDHEESKLLARILALAMAEAHLLAGHDVVVPQLLGRLEFINSLADLAKQSNVPFIEILLWDDEVVVSERFKTRRSELLAAGDPHPQADVDEHAVADTVAFTMQRLREVAIERPNTRRVTMQADVERSYQALCDVIGQT